MVPEASFGDNCKSLIMAQNIGYLINLVIGAMLEIDQVIKKQ